MSADTLLNHKPRAVIYCRVSTADQDNERQERDLRAYAERAGYHVLCVIRETASGARDDRKARAEIIARGQRRQLDIVLVTELSRWGRSTKDLITTVEDLVACKVSLVALNGMSFDMSTPSGKLMLTMLAGFSEFERDLIAERTKSGMASAKARGKHVGRPEGNRCYDKHKKQVVKLKADGLPIRAIASRLSISTRTVQDILALP